VFKPVAVLVTAGLCAPLLAQAQSLPERASSWVERNPRRLVRQINGAGLYASVGNLGEGAGSGPGVAYFDPDFSRTGLDLYVGGATSFAGDSLYDLRLGRIPHEPGRAPSRRRTLDAISPSLCNGSNERPFFLYAELRGHTLANGRIYTSSGAAAMPFVSRERSVELVAGRVLPHGFVASVRTGWLETQATFDARPGSGSPFDNVEERSFFATTASLAYDRRDQPRDPRRGAFVEASLARYQGLGRDAASFDRFSLDARRYLPLGSERHVLALRGLVGLASGRGEGAVPFFMQSTLGGSRTLRGVPQYRFRGPRMTAASAEYRAEVKGPLELAAFGDAGRVWGGAAETGTHGLVYDYGVGLRIKAKGNVLLRLDAARGSEGSRIGIAFGATF
jgi:hypothetical protein